MRGSMRERRPGHRQLRIFEGTDPLTGKKRYRAHYFRGGKRAAQKQLALLVAEVDCSTSARGSRRWRHGSVTETRQRSRSTVISCLVPTSERRSLWFRRSGSSAMPNRRGLRTTRAAQPAQRPAMAVTPPSYALGLDRYGY